MAKIKVKVVGSGEPGDPRRVNLPTYQMIPGSEKYGGPKGKTLLSCEVLVPDDELDDQGRLSKARIRAKYKGQKRWDHKHVAEDLTPPGFEPGPAARAEPEPAAEAPESLWSKIKRRLKR